MPQGSLINLVIELPITRISGWPLRSGFNGKGHLYQLPLLPQEGPPWRWRWGRVSHSVQKRVVGQQSADEAEMLSWWDQLVGEINLILLLIGEEADLWDAGRFLVGRKAPVPTSATREAVWTVQSASSVSREYVFFRGRWKSGSSLSPLRSSCRRNSERHSKTSGIVLVSLESSWPRI